MSSEDTATEITFVRESNGTLAQRGSGSPPVWAFAVDYGDSTYVCVSWEQGGDVYIGLVDVAAGVDSAGEWPIVATMNITDAMKVYRDSVFENVADHFHEEALSRRKKGPSSRGPRAAIRGTSVDRVRRVPLGRQPVLARRRAYPSHFHARSS